MQQGEELRGFTTYPTSQFFNRMNWHFKERTFYPLKKRKNKQNPQIHPSFMLHAGAEKNISGGMRNYQEKLIKSYEQLQIESHHVSRAERKNFFPPLRYAMHCRKFYIAVNR